jgi:hypothetical protein
MPDRLWGVELDPEAAKSAQVDLPQAHILTQNFFTLEPDKTELFDAIIGNPPYTRAEWFGRLHREAGRQLALDLDETGLGDAAGRKEHLLPRELWAQLDGRSGLHAYFFLHSIRFLREGGRLGFVVPNGWLDVAYGQKLKQFLLDHFRIMVLLESGVERWFHDAKVNTCLVVLEKCSGPLRRDANLVRLIRLRRRLRDLIPIPLDDRLRPSHLDRLVTRLLPSSNRQSDDYGLRVLPQRELDATTQWGLALRSPAVYRQRLAQADIPSLASWATIRRGFTTGANAFFYLNPAAIEKWGIEPQFRRPVLKSLRGIDQLRLTSSSCGHELLHVTGTTNLKDTAAASYIAWGEGQGFHLRRTCASRHPWYSLPEARQAHLILPKGVWRRHFAAMLDDKLPIDQQLYGLTLPAGVSPFAAAALLNSTWFALQCELHGRLNFGEGVLWLAIYEIGSMRLPDPRQLLPSQLATLEQLFTQLAQRPLLNIDMELVQPDRQALDAAVFDLLGFSESEQTAVLEALLERVEDRLRRASSEVSLSGTH